MREIFTPREKKRDPGRVFYTLRREDIGKTVIDTEIGPIHVKEFIGQVLRIDVGKRLYRVPNDEKNYWFWQMENQEQYERRLNEQRRGEAT